MDLRWVRRQRVQILSRTGTPPMWMVLFWTLALNVRLVRGALRSQRPECLCLILRPKRVLLAQMSHLATISYLY